MNSIKLNNGNLMPMIGLGTWLSKPGEVGKAVLSALEIGYRHLDCAPIYRNEDEIGDALKCAFEAGLVKREDVFVTSKLWNTNHKAHDVRPALIETLCNLKLTYLDLYLIHWPISYQLGGEMVPRDDKGKLLFDDVDHMETWKAMEACQQDGLVKSIGLSNFNSKQIKNILDHGRIRPSVLQVEMHPFLQQEKLVNFCQQNCIAVTAYSSFGNPGRPWSDNRPCPKSVLDHPTLVDVARKQGKRPAQVVLRWLVQRGVIVIPKSTNEERLAENFEIFDFCLSEEDMKSIETLDLGLRFILPMITKNGVEIPEFSEAPDYPYNEEF